jgi:hypothetical protein
MTLLILNGQDLVFLKRKPGSFRKRDKVSQSRRERRARREYFNDDGSLRTLRTPREK